VTICLVTDRRRFDPPVDGLLALVRDAVHAGIDLVQIRERDLPARELAQLVTEALGIAFGSATKVVVNDRLDVALACGADGVHLRTDSVGIADVRRIVPPRFLVGRSVHGVEEVLAAEGADYLIAGTVYATESKPEACAWLGTAGLKSIVQAAHVPVLAIGGVRIDRVADIAATGAAGFAAISLFTRSPIADVVAEARRRFDTVKRGP
jgi:thiamine-phosphate pyrophosphorylase